MQTAANVIPIFRPTAQSSTGFSMHQALDALSTRQWGAPPRRLPGFCSEAPIVLVLGVATHQLGQPSALATLARAVALAPQDPQFHFNYAVALAKEGQAGLAMVEYRACLELQLDRFRHR